MNPTRRFFLQQVSCAALASFLPAFAFAQKRPGNQTETMDDEGLSIFDGVSTETFKQWIGTSFRMSRNGRQVGTLVLASIKETNPPEVLKGSRAEVARVLPGSSVSPSTASFSLRFQGTGKPLPQDTYTLTHSWLGTFPLFLVPSGAGTSRTTYTATFNLLNGPQTNQ